MDLRLDGLVAIVTGAGQGIGAGIAQAYVQAGACVVVADVMPPECAGWDVATLQSPTMRGLYLVADVSDEHQVQQIVDTTIERFGRIDILVNNAGVISQAPVADLTIDEWDRIMATNLRSVFLCCRAVLPHMLNQGSGRIINIAS